MQKPMTAAHVVPIAKRGDLEARFRMEPAFQDVVYAVFNRVLTPNMIMALTYNGVFGKLWRAVCRARQVQTP